MKFTVTQDYLDSCAAIQKIQAPMTSSSVDLNTKATVVVVTYKRPGMLKATIAQLLYQDYPNLEIIVVDGSPNAEEVYRGLDLEVDRNVSYILSKTPNICVMRNLGLLASSGKIIVFIDDDVFICEDFITRHVKLHLTDYGKDAKLVAGHSIGDPREKIQWVKDSVTYCPKGRWARSVYGVNFSVKRRPAIECGGFNPYIPMVGDETELFTRMISDLEEAINGPEVALVHRVSRKGGCRIENKDPHQMARAMSGRLLSRLSVTPLYYLFLLFPGQIVRSVMSGELNHFFSLDGTRIFFREFIWYCIHSLRHLKRQDRYLQKSLELAKPQVLSGSALPILVT